MALLKWVLICEKAILEAGTNNVSLIGLLDEIKVIPTKNMSSADRSVTPARFAVVQLWTRSEANTPEIAEVRVLGYEPRGEKWSETRSTVNLSAHQNARLITVFAGFPMTGEGRYRFSVQARYKKDKWRRAGETSFGVHFVDAKLMKGLPQSALQG